MRLFLLVVLVFTSLYSSEKVKKHYLGFVNNTKGIVKVLPDKSIRKKKISKGYEISAGDMILTYSNANAIITLNDGSKIVLDKGSQARFTSLNEIQHGGGSIYYHISKRGSNNSLKIKTQFAIIGIKGTTFIVNDSNDSKSVSLKEGLIGVASIKEEFELHRKKVLEEYERYKLQQELGFEAYKKAIEEDIVTNVNEFELSKGKKIDFSGKRVDENQFEADDSKKFDKFENILDAL